jgi:hypothetical protein
VLSLPPDELWAIEIKRNSVPKVGRGFHEACADLKPSARFVVYPGVDRFPLGENLSAVSLRDLILNIKARFQ